MSTETEVKYRLAGLEQYEKFASAAESCSDRSCSYVLEDNMIFDWPDGRLRLADSALRIRLRKNLLDDGQKFQPVITFKGPRQSGIVKIRKEVEFSCDSAANAREVFESLGMKLMLRFEKRRRSFAVAKSLVELDELPRLGFFMEIEGPSPEEIEQTARLIGADSLNMEHRSYARLVNEYLYDFDSCELTFE